MTQNIPPLDRLNELLDYDPVTGVLTWTHNAHKKVRGKVAGTLRRDGYLQLRIDNKFYGAHRVCYYIHHHHLPEMIDHINNNRNDNRITNLRESNPHHNQQNRSDTKRNGYSVSYYREHNLPIPQSARDHLKQVRKAKADKDGHRRP